MAQAQNEALVVRDDDPFDLTLDLAALAGVGHGEQVKVEALANRTLELFERTLRLLNPDAEEAAEAAGPQARTGHRIGFMPEHEDLRERYLFAAALGSYATVNDLLDAYSPGNQLSQQCREKAGRATLSETEVRTLETYHTELEKGLAHAHEFVVQNAGTLSDRQVSELHDLLIAARNRSRTITRILGTHLIHEVEGAVRTLQGYHQKMRSVHQSMEGIFLVDSEVMFIPANGLIDCVNTIFKAVGNPYLADNIDGLLLLAARNLLIEVVSFYSYYGKSQIATLFRRGQASVSRHTITYHIREEIRKIFQACRNRNKLVLTRVMDHAEREFELSIEAIQREAENSAIKAVRLMLPEPPAPLPVAKKGWVIRVLSWLTA